MGFFSRLFGREEVAPPEPVTFADLAELRAEFPFEMLAVPGRRVEEELLRLREVHAGNAVPVIVGLPESAREMIKSWNPVKGLDSWKWRAETFRVAEWFERQRGGLPGGWLESVADLNTHPGGDVPRTRLLEGADEDGAEVPEVVIVVVPVEESWMLPLALRFNWHWQGAGHDEPHVHAGLAHEWWQRHGAEIAVMTFFTLEFTVARPPETEAEAMQLAIEHTLYSSETLFGSDTTGPGKTPRALTGAGSLPAMARALQGSTRWTLRWK